MAILKGRIKYKDLKVDFTDTDGKQYKDIDIKKITILEDLYFHPMSRIEFAKYFGRFRRMFTMPDNFFYEVDFGHTATISPSKLKFKYKDQVLSVEDLNRLTANVSEDELNQAESAEQSADPTAAEDPVEAETVDENGEETSELLEDEGTDELNEEYVGEDDSASDDENPEVPKGKRAGEQTPENETGSTAPEQTLSMVTHVRMPDENDPKKMVSMVKVRNYRVTNNPGPDSYIRIGLLRNKKQVLVKLSDLQTTVVDENGKSSYVPLTVDNLDASIGKNLIVKIDGVEYETEKLTAEQLTTQYESIKTYEISRKSVPDENTYIRTERGQFVKEEEVFQPISYKFANDGESFSHYLFTVGSGSETKTVIVSEKFVKDFSGDNVKIDGAFVPKSNGRKLRKCSINECDVIQTSTDGKDFNTCKITTKDPANPEENKKDDLLNIRDECWNKYKAGTYEIDSVYLPNKDDPNKLDLVKVDTKKRYEYTDEHIMDDKSTNLFNYRNTKFEPLKYTYDSKKNRIKLTGGPKYDAKKGIINSYKDLGKVLGYSLPFFFTFPGMLALFAAPALVAAYFGAMAVAVPLIPIIHGIKALSQKVVKKFKDKLEYNRKKNQATDKATILIGKVQKELNKSKELTDNQRECMFNSAMNTFNVLEQELLMNGPAHYNSAFVMKDGVGEVDAGNARFAGEFARETNKMIRQKSRLERAHKKYEKLSNKGIEPSEKLKNKEEKYNNLDRDIKARTTDYIAENDDYEATKNYEKQKLALKIAKNLTLMKINPWAFDLTEANIGKPEAVIAKILSKMKVDVKALASKDLVAAVGNIANIHPVIVKRILEIAKTKEPKNVELEVQLPQAETPVERNIAPNLDEAVEEQPGVVRQNIQQEQLNEDELNVT